MACPLRVEFPSACYHVINRGNFRFPASGEDRDRELILGHFVPALPSAMCGPQTLWLLAILCESPSMHPLP